MKPQKHLVRHELKLDLRSIPRPSMPHHTCHSSLTSNKSAHEVPSSQHTALSHGQHSYTLPAYRRHNIYLPKQKTLTAWALHTISRFRAKAW